MREVLGQDRAIAVLQTQWSAGRLHHAYIFHGQAGIGKFTTALAFARLLLCHEPQTDLTGQVEPCGACPSCRLLRNLLAGGDLDAVAAAHPDLHIIRKELAATSSVATVRSRKQMNIPVDVIREQMVGGTTQDGQSHDGAAWKSPALGHGKVFLIDEAELLDNSGANAMLKTLEEPSPGTTIILVTSSEDQLLPTIRSRCQRVAFAPLTDAAVLQWSTRYAGQQLAEAEQQLTDAQTTARDASRKSDRDSAAQQVGVLQQRMKWLEALPSDERLQTFLRTFAGGSIGRAKLFIDYDLLNWAATLLPAVDGMARGQFDTQLGSDLQSLIDGLAQAWVAGHHNASKEAANRMSSRLCWSMLASHLRQRLVDSAATAPPDPLEAEPKLEPWIRAIDALGEAERLLGTNVNMGLVCDHLAVRLAECLAPLKRLG